MSTKKLQQDYFRFLGSDCYNRINALEVSGCSFTNCVSTGSGGAITTAAQIGQITIGKEGEANANIFTNCKSGSTAVVVAFALPRLT